MSIFIIVVIGILLISFVGVIFLAFYYFRDKSITREDKKNEKIDWITKGLIFISLTVLVFSFVSPYLFTRGLMNSDFDFKHTGEIGDTIGGIMNPFISIVSVIVTGLAFYMQYRANKIQRELFHDEQENATERVNKQFEIQKNELELQKFESQFYEMLRIHRENVNDWKFKSSNVSEETLYEGRIVSVEMFKQFLKLKLEIEDYNSKVEIQAKEYLKDSYKTKITNLFPNYNLNELVVLEIAYVIFHYGLSSNALVNIYIEQEKYNDKLKSLILYLLQKPAKYCTIAWKKWEKGKSKADFNQFDNTYIKYYGGHEHRLSHYFRHLYSLIRLVDNQTQLSYLKKWEYIGIVRSQLSNKEQFLLFVNSISYLGRGWEFEPFSVDKIYTKDLEQRKFITKYDLIRHIPAGIRDEFKARILYPNVEYERDESLTLERARLEKEVYK